MALQSATRNLSCVNSAPHLKAVGLRTLTLLADIYRISRQDSANMAHGKWPSKKPAFLRSSFANEYIAITFRVALAQQLGLNP